MARKDARHVSESPATQWLRRQGIAFTEHVYDYVEQGGTAESAQQLGLDEHAVVKTLVMQDDRARPLIVLLLPRVCINGGRRGFLVGIEPKVLTEQLGATPVDCAL